MSKWCVGLCNTCLFLAYFFHQTGSLATGQGTRYAFIVIYIYYFKFLFGIIRFVLAATEHLHRRISKLSGRIRQLEDALAALHAKHSTGIHPLLHEDLMNTDEREESEIPADDTNMGQASQTGDVIDAFGTLSISEHGISRFFGPTGGSEVISFAFICISFRLTPGYPCHRVCF